MDVFTGPHDLVSVLGHPRKWPPNPPTCGNCLHRALRPHNPSGPHCGAVVKACGSAFPDLLMVSWLLGSFGELSLTEVAPTFFACLLTWSKSDALASASFEAGPIVGRLPCPERRSRSPVPGVDDEPRLLYLYRLFSIGERK